MKKFLGALIGALLFCATYTQASAMDRVQYLYGQNPPSSWANYAARYTRLGFGQLIYDLYANTNGFYSNLTANPTTGLFVAVGPSGANTIGSLYQYLPEEATSFGGPGGTSLSADANQLYLQGLSYTAGNSIGPLAIGTSGGQSVIDLMECKVQTIDQTSQTGTFVSSLGVVTTSAVNRDRADTIACQYKPSTSSATPVIPSPDTGYISVGYFTIPFGTVSVTGGMYTPVLTTRFSALSNPLYSQTGQTLPGIPHSAFISTTISGSTTTCGPMVTYYCATVVLSGAATFTNAFTFTCITNWSSTSGFGGYQGSSFVNVASNAIQIAFNNGTTLYIGGLSASFASAPVTFTCSGY